MFASQDKIDAAQENEYQELAGDLWYLRQDLSDEAVNLGFLPRLSELYGGFPDSTEKIAGLLKTTEGRTAFITEVSDFAAAYQGNRELLRFRLNHMPQALVRRLESLEKTPEEFKAVADFAPAKGNFITQDEIDHMLTRGSGVSEGKLRIYSYFIQGHDAKERAAFLKSEYGDGGHSYTGYDEWHDSKGIKLSRADDFSSKENYDTVRLNWNQTQKRIGELLDAGRYLNPDELAYMPEYEKTQLARSIYTFYYCNPNDPERTYPHEWKFEAAGRDIRPLLDDPEKSAALYADMVKVFAVLTPEERNYAIMQKALDDMAAYQRGEYSLFTPLPEEALQGERQIKQTAKKTKSAPKKETEPAPTNELEAAARALARKSKVKTRERNDGQLTFDFAAMRVAEPEEPPTPPKTKTVVEAILSPGLERERKQKAAAREKAVQTLEQRGLVVSDELLDAAMVELYRDATNADAIVRQVEETLRRDEEEAILSQYDLGYGHMGNGLTVWNRLEEENGDYKTIAHIAPDRTVTFYDKELPELIQEQVKEIAATSEATISATQDAPVFSTPARTGPVQEQPQNLSHIEQEAESYNMTEAEPAAEPQEQERPATESLTDLQKKAAEIAGRYEKLPLQEKIGVIAQAFGCTTGKIETSPCTGKWRGTSDISIRFDNGASLFIGNYRTPKAKTAKVQNECVNRALVQYNPEIISATKEAAAAVLMKREAKDNEIAAQKGLKPYTLLNVEFNNGSDEKNGGYIGWYYVTLAVDGKICAHMDTGLNYDIAAGKVSETPTRANYFAAGGLKETDVDYVFNSVGFSSASNLYSLPIRDDVRERAEKTLAARGATAPSTREQANSAPTISELKTKSPADLYHEFLPKMQERFEGSVTYNYLRNNKPGREAGIEETRKQLDRLAGVMDGPESGSFREAYAQLPLFAQWLASDVYDRATRAWPEARENSPDLVTLRAYDNDAPAWAHTGTKEPPEKSFVELYRETLTNLLDAVRGSSFYDYLSDRDTTYDEAKVELDSEIAYYMGDIAEVQPVLYHAYTSLPLFREWLIEDILERTHQDYITDNRDSIARHADDPDAPEWARETVNAPVLNNTNPAEKSVASLYRESLTSLIDMVRWHGDYSYLRDEDTDYREAETKLSRDMDSHINRIAEKQPALHHAYTTLPMFRELLIQDILKFTYSVNSITDYRDAIARFADDPDAPEWARETATPLTPQAVKVNGPETATVGHSTLSSEREQPSAEKSPAVLYREALAKLVNADRTYNIFRSFRDKDTQLEKELLSTDIGRRIGSVEKTQPALYHAYLFLPKFRDWLIEDILKLTHSGESIADYRDAIARFADDPDAPEWAREAAVPPAQEQPDAANSKPEAADPEGNIPSQEAEAPEITGAGVSEAAEQPPAKKPGRTAPELNYRAFTRLFPDISIGKYTSLRLRAGESMMPLCIELIGDNEISIAHYYRQNGDSMADPEMTFRIDHAKQTLEPLTYQQDSLGLYQQVYPEPGKWIPKLRGDLNRFAAQWFRNIREQEYLPERAVTQVDGKRVEVTFNGPNPATEEPASAVDNTSQAEAGAKDTTDAGVPEAQGTEKIWRSPGGVEYRAGDAVDALSADSTHVKMVLDRVDDDYIYYTFPDLEQEPVNMFRERFEGYLDDGSFQITGQAAEISQDKGEGKPQTPDSIVVHEVVPIATRIIKDEAYQNARLNSDEQNARVECEAAIDRAVLAMLPEKPALYDAYFGHPDSAQRVRDYIFKATYLDIKEKYGVVGDPDVPPEQWGQPAAANSEPEATAPEGNIPPQEAAAPEATGMGAPAASEQPEAQSQEPNLTPNVEEYLNLKAQYPDKLIGVYVGGYYLYYGKDAEEAAPALGAKLLMREIPGLGETFVTGGTEAWQAQIKKLLEHGHSVVLAQPDQERPEGPYEIVNERDIADFIPIGMELTIDGQRMKIDSINYETGRVSLMDMAMRGNHPIFRDEPVPFVREYVEEAWEKELEDDARLSEMMNAADAAYEQGQREPAQGEPEQAEEEPPAEAETPELVEIDGGTVGGIVGDGPDTEIDGVKLHNIVIDLTGRHTEPQPQAERQNFHITDDNLGVGGQKTKYQQNVAAIRTLKQIEAESRLATPEEQEILSKYVGWGGLAQAFNPDNEKWAKEYAELKELLTPEEYRSAKSTVLNAHYTSPAVIKAIYEAVGRMDFTPGNVLEPSCGIGNFFGLVPEKLADARLFGVELDSITGRIAKQLYQKADITVGGFETTDHPDDFFDLAVGNVPFGEYKVHDKKYDKQNLLIHDYFLTKTLDKVRPGGVVAFITTKGTMDKQNAKVRESLAQKADLLGAVRLPNTAFKANAGTEVTCDILFFQKRGSVPEKLPDWVQVGETEDGVPLNNYFLQHPEMVLGRMAFWKNMYGNETETACLPVEGADLSAQLAEAVQHIAPPDPELLHLDAPEQDEDEKTAGEPIPADPNVRNFSFALSGGKIYYRENSRMKPVELGKMPTERVKGMIGIRDCARKLIDLQLGGADDGEIKAEQARLNTLYDRFRQKYGLINDAGNRLAFRQDSSYPLLCSLEVLDEDGKLKRKADMFTKRTISHHQAVTSVDTAVEALAVSIAEEACVDLGYMASLMGGSEKIPQIVGDLKGVIFKDPATGPFDMEGANWHKGWQTADEYLSGDVRKKLAAARAAAERHPEFAINVQALEQVQPKDLTAAEISVRIGASWIKPEYYKQFMFELMQTPYRLQDDKMDVLYSDVTGEYNVKGKNEDSRDNVRVHTTYGTKRINAYEIFEQSLNQRSVQIFDTSIVDGKERRVLNGKETAIAQQKQELMAEAFRDWIFKDPERRADLCKTYNTIFNSIRPREYNGEHIRFVGMNPEISLRPHQRNAVARMLYGGNTLLAHCVGAGKTYTMTAAAMEAKRLGLCQKSLFVVPNHLTEQWGGDFLTLYPGAKVLVATKKDFKPRNRKKFCARIATGDYDAVIIGHSQFEKIPISAKRQAAIIEEQIDEIIEAIDEAKRKNEEKFTIKQMEKTRKNLEAKLKKLYDKKKDDTVTFEELGIDRLFVDEAHYYKNLYMHTKMRNVGGISQTEAQKSSDMFAKCRYLDEITGGRGVTFATGTPISNSMVELYTMMRYLQYSMLEERGLKHFDSWAADFGEKVTAVELKPEGTGFRTKTRFARFYNLPELINMWKEAADIQTADMLNLPTPEPEYITVQTEPSEAQKQMVQSLAERAEVVRKGQLDPRVDNMLKITSDGRKLALDQRIMNPLLPDDPDSKVNACVGNVFQIWQDSAEIKGTQLVFCDLSTPKGKADKQKASKVKEDDDAAGDLDDVVDEEAERLESSVYQDIRKKLIAKGIPVNEIAFIHDAKTDTQKAELFAKVRKGQVRILLGSTQKMGAGTNVQDRIVASHDLDCPWRPADLEQRLGRSKRQGNMNKKIKVCRYVTKGTFDAYNWGLVESKQRFIGQVMTSKAPARSIEDVDATALSFAEVKMLATGDERIKEKMDLDIQVSKLKMLKANHNSQKYEMEDKARIYYPQKIQETQLFIDCLTADLPILQAHPVKEDAFSMTIQGKVYTERKEAGEAIVKVCKSMKDPEPIDLGEFRGFPMRLCFDGSTFKVTMKQHLTYTAELSGESVVGNIARINNALEKIPESLQNHKENLIRLQKELENAREEAERPFPQEEELAEKSARLNELNAALDQEERGGAEPAQEDAEEPARAEDSGPEQADSKPSIIKSLREYERPAPVPVGVQRGDRQEAAL